MSATKGIINKLNGYTIQDARLDGIINRNGKSNGYRGITYNSQTGGLELTNGGYYTTGFAVRDSYDVNQPDSHNLTNDNVVKYTVLESRTLHSVTSGGDGKIWLNFKLNPGESGEESFQIDEAGTFEYDDNSGLYYFNRYVEDNDSYDLFQITNVIEYVAIDMDNMKFQISFDSRGGASAVDFYEIQLYAFEIEPMPFPPEMIDFNEGFIYIDYEGNIRLNAQLFTDLVQAVIDGKTINDNWEVEVTQ